MVPLNTMWRYPITGLIATGILSYNPANKHIEIEEASIPYFPVEN